MISWFDTTLIAMESAWQGLIGFLPSLLGDLIVFFIGWLISLGIGKLVTKLLNLLRLNQFLDKLGWRESLEKVDIKFDASEFFGALIKWSLVIVFLMAAAEILSLYQLSQFLAVILSYIPNIVVSALIFVIAVILADFLERIIKGSAQKAGVSYARFLGAVVRWTILVFAGIAILLQLGVATTIINALVIGFVAMLSLAGGLAFGLGGKDEAKEIIKDIKKKISEEIK
jgi:small-conductance mechanosensitive channel